MNSLLTVQQTAPAFSSTLSSVITLHCPEDLHLHVQNWIVDGFDILWKIAHFNTYINLNLILILTLILIINLYFARWP